MGSGRSVRASCADGSTGLPSRPTTMSRMWWPSAPGWTGCRWPSSWPPPGRNSSRPHAILSRLDRSLELGGTELERPTRQRTLRQTIAWSFDLLTRDQQRFFSQLGVFGGSCDLDALAAVTKTSADPLDEVAELVDVSLVRILDDRRRGAPRRPAADGSRVRARTPESGRCSGSRRHGGTLSTTSRPGQTWLLGCAAPSTSSRATASKPSWTTSAPLWSGAFQFRQR